MMARLSIPIGRGDKTGDNSDYRDSLLVNYVLVPHDIKGAKGYIISHPGIESFSTGVGADRGAIFNPRINTHLRVSGDRLVSINENGISTIIGIIPGSSQVSIPYSFQTQGILSNGRFFLYDGTNLNEVFDPDLGSPIDVDWINGVYFFTDGETLYHTDADDEFSIDPLAFATSEFSPDRTIGVMKTQQNQMAVFNRYTTEFFADGGGENFRFRRIDGKAVEAGIVGTYCKTKLDGNIFIMGGRKEESTSVHILSGGSIKRIATREIEQIIESYTESQQASAVMESREEKANKYLLIHLPNHTLLYNHTIAERFGLSDAWALLKSDIDGDTTWRAINGIYDPRVSRWLYGDKSTVDIGALTDENSLQYGQEVEGIFYTKTLNLETKSIDFFEIEHIPGKQADDIRAFFSLSYDGVTYGTEYSLEISALGEYNKRFGAYRLGYVRHNFNFKFRVVSGGVTAFSGLYIEYE